MDHVHVMDHPLILHKLSLMRDRRTGVKEFREATREIATLLCYEATRNLPLETAQIETPLTKAEVRVLTGKKIAVVPILRAGLGMLDGILGLIPAAKVGHLGVYRDPETLRPVDYYCKLPADIAERDVMLLDPMIATGGTAAAAVQTLKDKGAQHIMLISLLASPDGLAVVQQAHPEVEIFVAAIDPELNDEGYIVPGLGDAGDRIFGTK